MATEEELIRARRAHAGKLVDAKLKTAFPNDFRADDQTYLDRQSLLELVRNKEERAKLPHEADLEEDEPHRALFGRVVAKRGPFLVIRTPYGDAQALVRKEKLPLDDAAQYDVVDLADHVLVQGPAIQTKTGELAVSARKYKHLAKALLPPPDKWHGLTDVEKRYRERYVDLFTNPEVAEVFRARTTMIKALRSFLDERKFLEVETPLLHLVRGGATAKPFETHHNALDLNLYLRIAPELYLKRLLVGGFDRVYEIGRSFRNEGISTKHNPEFTLFEAYMAYATYEDLITLTEQLLLTIDRAVREKHPTLVHGRPFTFEAGFKRVTLRQALADRIERSGSPDMEKTPITDALSREAIFSDEPQLLGKAYAETKHTLPPEFVKAAQRAAHHGELLFVMFEQLVEPALTSLYRTEDGAASLPVFITEYPFEVSPLARRNDENPRFVDRFELYIEGREVANAFSELNDPDDQRERFLEQGKRRAQGDEETMDYDADYIRALSHGMPPAAGLGIGIDRLVMLFCSQPSIRDVLLFPLLRPEDK